MHKLSSMLSSISKFRHFVLGNILMLMAGAPFAVQAEVPSACLHSNVCLSYESGELRLETDRDENRLFKIFDPHDLGAFQIVAINKSGSSVNLVEPELTTAGGLRIRPINSPTPTGAYEDRFLPTVIANDVEEHKSGRTNFPVSSVALRLWRAGDFSPKSDGVEIQRISVENGALVAVAHIQSSDRLRTEARSLVIRPLPLVPGESKPYSPTFGFMTGRGEVDVGRHPSNAARARLRIEDGEPIIIYLDPSIPEKWVPWVKRGVEEWNVALVPAGLKGVVAESIPTSADWNVVSATSNHVSWHDNSRYRDDGRSSPFGGTANTLMDERSGEILQFEVVVNSPIQMLSDWYFTRCGGAGSRLSFHNEDELILGRMLQALVAHETGHALGLKDGSYGKFAYRLEDIRRKEWIDRWGFSPSIMNYTRCNSSVQSSDNVSLDSMFPRVGPSDIYQMIWNYRGEGAADAYLKSLPPSVRRAVALPVVFAGELPGPQDDSEVSEALDNRDTIASARLSVSGLRSALQEVLPAVSRCSLGSCRPLDTYGSALGFWNSQANAALSLLGGRYYEYEDGRSTIKEVDPDSQREAVSFLLEEFFADTSWIRLPVTEYQPTMDIKYRISVNDIQRKILSSLFSKERLIRLYSTIVVSPKDQSNTIYLFDTVADYLFSEKSCQMSGEEACRLQYDLIKVVGDSIARLDSDEVATRLSDIDSSERRSSIVADLRSEITILRESMLSRRGKCVSEWCRAHLDRLISKAATTVN